MIDYMLRFADEAAARLALPFPADEEGAPIAALPPSWAWGAHSIAPIRLFRLTGPADPETGEPTPEYVSGFWLSVYTREGDESVWAMPACMVEADRAGTGPTRVKPEIAPLMAGVYTTPLPAGANYVPVEA